MLFQGCPRAALCCIKVTLDSKHNSEIYALEILGRHRTRVAHSNRHGYFLSSLPPVIPIFPVYGYLESEMGNVTLLQFNSTSGTVSGGGWVSKHWVLQVDSLQHVNGLHAIVSSGGKMETNLLPFCFHCLKWFHRGRERPFACHGEARCEI